MTFVDVFESKHLNKKLQLPIAIALLTLYGVLAYFTSRDDFYTLFSLVVFLFVLTYLLLEKTTISFEKLCVLSIIFRVVFIFSVPFLSQDFFRFIWDGQLVITGLNPYVNNVDFYFETDQFQLIENANLLKEGMGELNASNYSNYPPVSQFIYAVSALLSHGSVLGFIICLRVILVAFDIVFLVYARKLLKLIGKNEKLLFWYILNPLCILEITGNLHLEGVMISLFVASIYVIMKHKIVLSSILLSLSVSAKLLSLLFFPFILKHIYSNFKSKSVQSLLLYTAVFLLTLALPFLFFLNSEGSANFISSIGLWFTTFEFNASLYYLFRWVGYQIVGWNTIKIYGLIFPVLFLVIYSIFFFRSKSTIKSLFTVCLALLTVYFLLSTTIHPWYILFPLALGIFTRYKFPIVWSLTVFLSYTPIERAVFRKICLL